MDIYSVLYPRGLKRWFGVPSTFPNGSRSISFDVDGTQVDAIITETMGLVLTFFADIRIADDSYWIPIVSVNHSHFIDVPTPELYNLPGEKAKTNPFMPTWNIYMDGRLINYRSGSIDFKSKQITIPQLARSHKYDGNQSPFTSDASTLTIKFSVGDVEHPDALLSITKGQLRQLDREFNTEKKDRFVARHNGALWRIQPFPEYDLFDIDVTVTIPDAYWQGIQNLYERVFEIESTAGLVNTWMPVELANSLAVTSSHIIMAFYPSKSPLLQMFQYSTTTGQLMKRETVDDTNWITTTRLTWQIESVSLTIQAYHNVEKQFRALTDKHFVTLTDEEVVKMEQLLETLKRIRNTTYIKCQMCNNGIQSFVVKGGEMDGFAVCETCALSIKE